MTLLVVNWLFIIFAEDADYINDAEKFEDFEDFE